MFLKNVPVNFTEFSQKKPNMILANCSRKRYNIRIECLMTDENDSAIVYCVILIQKHL